MNVAFFGTSDRSIPILESLNENFNLVLCVTKTDTKVGRKQEIRQTAVKKWAIKNSIDYVEIDSLKDNNLANVRSALLSRGVKLGVVADFVFLIPNTIFSTPQYGMLNVHFSLLPKYRGASPVQHTILNGDKKTGVTFLQVDDGLDTGNIIKKYEYKLEGSENSEFLYKTLFKMAGQKIPNVIKKFISGTIVPQKQDESLSSYSYSKTHPKSTFVFKEDAQIDWSNDLILIDRAIRAYYPWPVAWTTLQDMTNANLLVSKDGLSEKDSVSSKDTDKYKAYKSSKKENLRVKIFDSSYTSGELTIKSIQVQGKNKIEWKDFLNGYSQS